MEWLQSDAARCALNEDGQSMVEYALILALIAVAVLGVFTSGVSHSVTTLFNENYQKLSEAFSNALHSTP